MLKAKSVEKADDPLFKIPFPLVWLRYSMFIVLYPTGVFGELMVAWMTKECMLAAMSAAQPNTMSGWTMQSLKFLFQNIGLSQNANIYYGAVFLSYVFGLPPLYMTLLAARRKQLAPPAKIDKAKKNQ